MVQFEDSQRWLCVHLNPGGEVIDRYVVHGGIVPILQRWPMEYKLTYLGQEQVKA